MNEDRATCPYCGRTVAEFTWLGEQPPRPPEGMPALCGACLRIAVFTGAGYGLRHLRHADRAALADSLSLAVLRAQLREILRIRGRWPTADPWLEEMTT